MFGSEYDIYSTRLSNNKSEYDIYSTRLSNNKSEYDVYSTRLCPITSLSMMYIVPDCVQ
jgi:hypothetical protein